MTEPLVKMRGITKRFGGVVALQDVDLEAYAGEVLAIVGDNGAGKSTLIKVLTGVYQPTEGEMSLDGKPIQFSSHADAIHLGIDAVYQTLALADHLAPPANMFLGSELTKTIFGITVLDNKRMKSETERVLMERLGVRLKSLDAPTESLSGGIDDNRLEFALERFGEEALTPREQEIAVHILKGHSSKSLAREINISPETVKIHRRNIYRKLQVASQSELFARFLATLG